jgi:protein-S-isoprenylcysteine O-methyltransferase Ste14
VVQNTTRSFSWKDSILACIYTPLLIFQLILFFFVYQNYYGITVLCYIGIVFWVLSAIFGVVPMIKFKREGGVAKGESYMKTTKLVDTGIYSIVRHPQYLAGLLLAIALMLMTQHWLSICAGVIVLATFYYDTLRADPPLIEKFGDEYRDYMERVPAVNLVVGIGRRLRRTHPEE